MLKSILLVEDEELLIGLLQKKLAVEGYNVSLARDGEEGLRKMKESRPDLILLDVIMPKMGGFAVLEEMQKDRELRRIPVIIISNSGQPLELDKAKKLGARDWLVKAEFNPQEIIDKVKKQI